MLGNILILVLFFAFFTSIIYLILYILILPFRKKISISKLKKYRFWLSFAIGSLSTYFFLFTSPVTNYKTASVIIKNDRPRVTIKGKRMLMAHDPISMFLRKTYEDSLILTLPKGDSLIKAEKISTMPIIHNLTGSIEIKKGLIIIDLHFANENPQETDPTGWNGKYISQ